MADDPINKVARAAAARIETLEAVATAALALHDATWNQTPHPVAHDATKAEWDALGHALAVWLGYSQPRPFTLSASEGQPALHGVIPGGPVEPPPDEEVDG